MLFNHEKDDAVDHFIVYSREIIDAFSDCHCGIPRTKKLTFSLLPRWDTADEEIYVLFVEAPELAKVLFATCGGRQNIALHVSPTARSSAF